MASTVQISGQQVEVTPTGLANAIDSELQSIAAELKKLDDSYQVGSGIDDYTAKHDALAALLARAVQASTDMDGILKTGDPNYGTLGIIGGTMNIDQGALAELAARVQQIDADFQQLGYRTAIGPVARPPRQSEFDKLGSAFRNAGFFMIALAGLAILFVLATKVRAGAIG